MTNFLTYMISIFSVTTMSLILMCYLVLICAVCLPILFFVLRLKHFSKKKEPGDKLKVAFFHPYCNTGGGGEKVLWVAIQALQKKYPDVEFYVYTGDIEVTPDVLLLTLF